MPFLSQGLIAPLLIESSSLGIIKSLSKIYCSPRPSQILHAPDGLLNEKSLGSISSIVKPDTGHANLAEKIISLSSSRSLTIKSSSGEILRAVSILSVSLCFKFFLIIILSTITSILFFLFLSISGKSAISTTTLFIRIL